MGVVEAVISLAANNQSLLIAAVLLLVFVATIYSFFSGGQKGINPLQYDHRRAPEPFVHDTKLRDVVLRERFKPTKVPDNLDAIIIGSGAGGLSAGVLLTFAGLKVLVLEQHDQAGGCCHTFVEKGFEFDTGVHYVGDIEEGDVPRILVDQVTCGQLRWAKMDDAFDIVAVGKSSNAKLFPMKSGEDRYYQNLVTQFPQEKAAIMAYADLIKDTQDCLLGFIALKMMPWWLVDVFVTTGLYRWVLKCYRRGYASTSLQNVLDKLTDNKKLKLILSYLCSDYGVLPKDVSFFLHAILVNHFRFGAYYPTNGTSEIPFHMIQTIQRAGGKVLVQASVTKILCDSVGRAVGVRVGKSECEIRAKYIISDAGVTNTFKKLLPENVARQSSIYPLIDQVGPSYAFLSTFIGVEGSTRDLNLPASNIWYYNAEDINQSLGDYLKVKAEEVEDTNIPFSFIAFPSAKDPEYETKFPGKSSALVITLANWEWFKEWKDEKVRHRGDRYEGIKDALGRQMWQQCVDLFPQLEGRKVYMEVGTPVTNQHYLAYPHGEMYGLDQGLTRYTPEVARKLRPATDIKGLYLTGQDTLFGGMIPAVLTGMMCASQILNRNILNDVLQLKKQIGETNSLPPTRSFKTSQ
ncbi:unnamed protein product [Candidula unifasciata]|uniref:All-trans-retinol 13,14-reductase n=1 Tax=Candidula unifasciata TaxID=100452 RepID=A0A8S4A0C8_9EUPU|nr:unnamed protein product [Candidula unifasciata]